MKKNILEIKGITKSFGGQRAVDCADLAVVEGEVFSLVGESGCGKTTLSRIILDLISPDFGEVFIFGGDVRKVPKEELRKKAQIVFQDPLASLDPRMRIKDIISEPLTVHRICGKKDIRARSEKLLSDVGLSSRYLDRYPHEISGGEAQRVSIARAIATGPEFIILDEPVSSVDHLLQKVIIDLLMGLKAKKGLTYLFITHDLSLARQVSDRIAVMKDGKIIETGQTKEVFDHPQNEYTRQLIEDSI